MSLFIEKRSKGLSLAWLLLDRIKKSLSILKVFHLLKWIFAFYLSFFIPGYSSSQDNSSKDPSHFLELRPVFTNQKGETIDTRTWQIVDTGGTPTLPKGTEDPPLPTDTGDPQNSINIDTTGESEQLDLADSGEEIEADNVAAAEACESASSEAVSASSGMDMMSYAMMGQAVTGAVSASKGASASVAHKGNAAIQSTLSAVALKRCASCKSAISACETACSPEKCPPASFDETCPGKMKAGLKTCIAQETFCTQACLQGGLSGIQALTSIMSARALEDCPEGAENCGTKNEDPKKEETEEKLTVAMPSPTNNSFSQNSPDWGSPGSGKGSTEPMLPPENKSKKNEGKNQNENKKNTKTANQDKNNKSPGAGLSSLGGLGGSGSSGSNSQPFSYGTSPSGSSGFGEFAGNDEEYGEESVDDKNYPNSYAGRGAFGSSTGKIGYAGSATRSAGGAHGGGSGASKLAKSRKLAMNNTKKDTFGKGKRDGSIFAQMSRFIKEVCDNEFQCPQKAN